MIAVSRSASHTMVKPNQESIHLRCGLGVEGDAHFGETVKHRSRVRRDPSQPNLRQVHLIHEELYEELREAGFTVVPGQMGENVTTRGVDLLGLPARTVSQVTESFLIRAGLICKEDNGKRQLTALGREHLANVRAEDE